MSDPVHRVFRVGAGSSPAESLPPQAEEPIDPDRIWTPAIDIHEGPEGLILEADLPGVEESSLRIDLEHNVLNLQARVVRPLPTGVKILHEESPIAGFYRSFILTDDIHKEAIRAELKNGVLRLILPRAERAHSRRIEVSS